ncbi:pre-rRNA processing protein TSR2 [Histoplasma capsulatum G186AR]|uniref:Pre-rRNA processing protein TSR2 n=1 Tax=Ajellomyces capsulatus (strain G186AR / H82 / ATCC MYA-2454 / RMSCC 2432) TaxID=447093 RepID=C0NRY7_AJECG|nr:pre-rRNA processing protein TSR2 [Histoplasma capsulatum G186AR]EEH05653.1 pre-rRNA processing protein TSR2 [Histoplasma capsulatum G186AR]
MASISTTSANQNPIEKQREQAGNKQSSTQFDLGITLILNSWPALNLAVQSSWGGPSSSDKRDWLCGAISDLFVDRPETDAEDIEDVLIQVMNDEFDVVVDDESAGEIGRRIMEVRMETQMGDFTRVTRMWEEWKAKGGAGATVGAFRKVEVNGDDDGDDNGEGAEDEDEEEEDDNESDIGDWADDVEMEDAPVAVTASRNYSPQTEAPKRESPNEIRRAIDGPWERGKFLPEPIVDEDGFTKVVSKRRR